MLVELDTIREVYPYHLLRNALACYEKRPTELTTDEMQRVKQRADQSYKLESLVLSTPEADGLTIPQQTLQRSINAVAERYESYDQMLVDLELNGMDETVLHKALHRELLFDAVMSRVGATAESVDEVDVELFYQTHTESFTQKEKRETRHILVTINDDYQDNQREAAWAKLERVREQLLSGELDFADAAKRFSECPTAVEGGMLGWVGAGKLYPELDSVLFQLQPNEVSCIQESELGFHLLRCESVRPAQLIPFDEVKDKIKQVMHQRQIRSLQSQWLKSLDGA